jgi:hypothetical protein
MPIEVLGPAGTIVSTSFNVPSTSLQNVTINRLWLQIHALNYADKGSVQINNGAWINLNNTTALVQGNAARYGGIGGPMATLKMTVAIPSNLLMAGQNVIRFRFNRTDGVSMGFRVLRFNFMTTTGQMILPATAFQWEDPSTWQPPFSDITNITTGERLWRTASLIKSPLSNTRILARCTDCHAQDGRDLKYFNYSNRAIIERSRFHGLTTTQGMQIASYIRTRNVPNPGRPWNPPYQPGPGLDSKPVSEWAAGAGIDWVLDRDIDALPYIFPNGIAQETVATTGNLNVREIPIAMQLPDWNQWLPKIHPKDAFGTAFINHNLNKKYAGEGTGSATWNLRARLTSSTSLRYVVLPVFQGQSQFEVELGDWRTERTRLIPAQFSFQSREDSERVYGTALWQLVKTWEMMQEFNLEGFGLILYGPQAEARTWYTDMAFMASPFMLKIPNSHLGIGGNALSNEYLSNAWYQLQLVLNHSNRRPFNTYPIDWAYVYGKNKDLFERSRDPQIMRHLIWLIKAFQTFDNGIGPENQFSGWRPQWSADVNTLVHWNFLPMWRDVPAQTRAQIMQVMLRCWLQKSREFLPGQYYAGKVADPTQAPRAFYDGPLGNKMMWMIPQFRTAGVDGQLLNEVADWGQTLYPLGDWASLKR